MIYFDSCKRLANKTGRRVVILSGEKVNRLRITNLLSAVQKETMAETEFWEEDQPMDVETDEWFE